MVDVAQLVRASVCGSEGRGFESRLPPLLLIQKNILLMLYIKNSILYNHGQYHWLA